MTSTAPGAHPLPEEVDALLDPSGGDARVDAHVAGCRRCQVVRDGLREVRALLGRQARELPPEPPDLGARIAAALAAEPPLAAAAASAPATRDGATATPLGPRRRRPVTTWLAVAASVAVVGLGGTFLATRIGTTTSGDAGASAESVEQATSGGGEDAGGALSGVDRSGEPGVQGAAPTSGGRLARDVDGLASGADYTSATLADQAEQLLRLVDSREGQSAAGPPGTSERALADRGTLDACLVALGRPGADPVATDLATFEGEPAAVLVLPDGRGHEVVVVPDGCGSGDDRVLATTSLD